VSGQLEADLTASAADIARAAADEQRRALVEATDRTASEIRREADEQLSNVRSEFARERGELQSGAASEIAALERTLGDVRAQLDVAQQNLVQTQSTRDSLEHERDELTGERDALAHERDALTRERDALAQERDSLTRERDSLTHERHSLAQQRDALEQERDALTQDRGVLTQDRDSLVRERDSLLQERDALTQQAQSLGQQRHDLEQQLHLVEQKLQGLEAERTLLEQQCDSLELERNALDQQLDQLRRGARLAAAFRSLDEATTLGDILEHLARSACQESGRSAVFLVDAGRLRGWRAVGFDATHPIVGSEFEPGEIDVVGQAARLGKGQQHRNQDSSRLPAFASSNGPRDAVAFPVRVGGSVIAVLYADAARSDSPEEAGWQQLVDAMTQHAGRALEAMTVRQAAALWTTRPIGNASS
jgi:chromosome segregation ATPase